MSYTATYSPEDNKLRLYSLSRHPKDLYDPLAAWKRDSLFLHFEIKWRRP